MSDLVFGKTVEVEPVDTDCYGRTVAVVLIGPENVNREMVRRGAAWAYRQYPDDPSLVNLEAEANAHEQGLWALQLDQIMPPW
jgi:micrococcal nuclease